MKYLIYSWSNYDEHSIGCVETKDEFVEFAKKIIDDMGEFIVIANEHAEEAIHTDFNQYAENKLKEIVKELNRIQKEKEGYAKKTQKDLDKDYQRKQDGQKAFDKMMASSNATYLRPLIFRENLTQKRREILNKLNKLEKRIKTFDEFNKNETTYLSNNPKKG